MKKVGKVTKKFLRVLVKISGEVCGSHNTGLTYEPSCAGDLLRIFRGFFGAIVVGGGNIVRGTPLKENFPGFDGPAADHMGMQATLANGIFIREMYRQMGQKAVIMSALGASPAAGILAYNYIDARKILESGDTALILVGGIGTCGFTTDTAAVARANELKCDLVLKLTQVDGVYDCDPKKNPRAHMFTAMTHRDFLQRRLSGIFDVPAVQLAAERALPIAVSNKGTANVIRKAMRGKVGTMIHAQPRELQVRGKVRK